MLIAAAILFLMNSGSEAPNQALVDQAGTYIKKHIADAGRQETLQAILNDIKEEQTKKTQETQATLKGLIELDKDYASKRTQFDTLFKTFNQNQQNSYRAMLELRFQLKDSMSREEWEEAFAGEEEAGE
jgi:hypothetical protein